MNGRRAIAWANDTMLIVSSVFLFYGALTKNHLLCGYSVHMRDYFSQRKN